MKSTEENVMSVKTWRYVRDAIHDSRHSFERRMMEQIKSGKDVDWAVESLKKAEVEYYLANDELQKYKPSFRKNK